MFFIIDFSSLQSNFWNTISWRCSLEDNYIRSSLIECQSFLIRKIDVDPTYRVLMSLPCVVLVSCESFRNFVMCLHGLDILSTWVLFFSLLCATASAFQYSHLAKDLDVFVTNCMDNPRSCSAGVDETRVFGNCLYSLCRPCFLVSLVHLSKNSTVVSVSLFGLHANILGSMCC